MSSDGAEPKAENVWRFNFGIIGLAACGDNIPAFSNSSVE